MENQRKEHYIPHPMKKMALAVLLTLPLPLEMFAAESDFVSAVKSTQPIAYYRLTAVSGKSEVGSTTYQPQGGVSTASPSIFGPNSQAVKLNGSDAYILSSQAGGIGAAASIMTWVRLDTLPSAARHIFYVAGESESGNDLDIQFEDDDQIKFYTASGGHIEYKPAASDLVHKWHMIVATLDTRTQTRALYWDGKLVVNDRGGGKPGKSGAFSVGESTVFRGRYLNGSVEEAALWNRALSASEVTAIYAAAGSAAGPGAGKPGGPAASSAAPSGSQGSAPFPTSAKVTLEGPNGPLPLKPEEKTAFLFVSAVQQIESDCQFRLKRTCSMDEVLNGAAGPNGQRTSHLKYDLRTDPNYTYTVGALDTAWELHATPKKLGLMGFFAWARGLAVPTIVYNPNGGATTVDRQFTSTSVEGEGFDTH
jgi:hypothetical protein